MNEAFFEGLGVAMMDEFVAVNASTNPVARQITELDNSTRRHIVEQYVFFPRRIVQFLNTARKGAAAAGWQSVQAELTRNIGEELGTETDGDTHVAILARGLVEALGMHSVHTTPIHASTEKFLESVDGYQRSAMTTPQLLGATYALECSAVPELVIVQSLVQTLLDEAGAESKELKLFFDMHLGTWEPGHEDGLRRTVSPYLYDDKTRSDFEAGFRFVMQAMDEWWCALAELQQ